MSDAKLTAASPDVWKDGGFHPVGLPMGHRVPHLLLRPGPVPCHPHPHLDREQMPDGDPQAEVETEPQGLCK